MDLEELIEKWGRIGFLDGLPEELKSSTAMTYERASKILVDDSTEFNTVRPFTYAYLSGNFLITAIFPVIYRISKTGLVIKNVPDLIQKFDQFITDNRQVMDDLHGVDFDVEAEMCRLFAEDYCDWIKDNPEIDPIRYVSKHRL